MTWQHALRGILVAAVSTIQLSVLALPAGAATEIVPGKTYYLRDGTKVAIPQRQSPLVLGTASLFFGGGGHFLNGDFGTGLIYLLCRAAVPLVAAGLTNGAGMDSTTRVAITGTSAALSIVLGLADVLTASHAADRTNAKVNYLIAQVENDGPVRVADRHARSETRTGQRSSDSPKKPASLTATVQLQTPRVKDAIVANEPATLLVTVTNRGPGDAHEAAVTIDSDVSAGLTLDTSVTIGDIGPNESRTAEVAIATAKSLKAGKVNFRINVEDADGFDAPPISLSIPTYAYQAPHLQLTAIRLTDANGDGRVQRGEEIEVHTIVRNSGGPAKGLAIALDVGNDDILTVTAPRSQLGDLAPGEWKEAHFSFLVKNRYQGPDKLPIRFHVTDAAGDVTVNQPVQVALDQSVSTAQTIELHGVPIQAATTPPGSVGSDVDDPPDLQVAPHDDVAVVIGIERYNSKIPGVPFALRDATVMREYLTRSLGYRSENIIFLTNADATKSAFDKAFAENGQAWNYLKPNANLLVYYAGHGVADVQTGTPYLIPYDGDPNYSALTGVSLPSLYERLATLPAKSVTVMLDSCFSGQAARNDTTMLIAGARPLSIKPSSIAVPTKLTVMAASSQQQISSSYPDKQHGLFTYFLLKGLRGDADGNRDGAITTDEAYRYVSEQVPLQARRQNRQQSPTLTGPATVLRRKP